MFKMSDFDCTQEENEKLKKAMESGGVVMQEGTGLSPEGRSRFIETGLHLIPMIFSIKRTS